MPAIPRLVAAIILGVALASPSGGQEAGGARPAAGVLRLLPEPVTTSHTIRLGERSLDYAATAGTLPLRDAKGEVTAEIFHVAYVSSPADDARPVTFVFNGGPGAASAFLNLGAMGPRAVAFSAEGGYLPPPARLTGNPDTWLPFTDLVFVDPVGTGYSRAAGEGEEVEKRFFGVRQDASVMAAFVRLWLAQAGRTLSPLFLAGESYGGFRAALLARVLPEESGLAPSGVVLISPALEFSLLRGEGDHLLLPWAVTLPSLAATHLERRGEVEPGELGARLAEVERFALSGYLVELAKGQGEVSPELVERLAALTGLPPETVRATGARIPVGRFVKEYAREEGLLLSRYDGALAGPDPSPGSQRSAGPDPVLSRAVPVWTSAFVAHAREELGYRTEITYRLLESDVSGRWDFGTTPQRQGYAGAMDDLQAGRALNPALAVLIVHGYTDLVTPYLASRYLVDQLPPLAGAAPIRLETYPGGHMFYTRAGSRRMLTEDARRLYESALSAAASRQG